MKQSPYNRSLILLLGFLLTSVIVRGQQEQMYSQYMFNMLTVNPAYAGNRVADNITGLYRYQWVDIPGSPRTATLTWDRRADKGNVGYGLGLYNDRLGVENTSGVQGYYSYHIPFRRSSLALGVSAGVVYYKAELTRADLLQPDDPVFERDLTGWLPTVGFGALYSTDNWYLGFSIPTLLRTKVKSATDRSFIQKDAIGDFHYFLTGGYIFDLSPSVKLKPSALMKAVSGAPLEFDLNLNVWFSDFIGIGGSYRTGDAVLGMVELQITPQLRIGYAYDYSITALQNYNSGTHELLLRYEFTRKNAKQILSPRYY